MTLAPATSLAPTYAKLICVAAIYGGQYVSGRYLASYLSPVMTGTLRYVIAAAVLLVMLARSEQGWPRLAPRDWGMMVALGLTNVLLYNIFFFAGLEHITASRAALVSAVSPACVALAAGVVFRTRLDRVRWLGVGIALLGVAVVISDGDLASLLAGAIGIGDLYLLGSVAVWVCYAILGRIALQRFAPLTAVAGSAFVGTIMLVAVAITEEPWRQIGDLPFVGWVALAYLGIVSTALASLWLLQGVHRIGPARAAIFLNLVPVFGVLAGWGMLDEPLLPSLIIGGVIVLLGVALTNRPLPSRGTET